MALFCMAIFLVSPLFTAAQTSEDIQVWTFSDQLYDGDYFIWEVSYKINGNPVTTPQPNGPAIVDGSEVRIDVHGDPTSLNVAENSSVPTSTEADVANVFDYTIDGVTPADWELFLLFLFPNTIYYNDGTGGDNGNAYSFIVANNENPMFETNSTQTNTLQNGYYSGSATVNKDGGRTIDESISADPDTGMLSYYSRSEVNDTTSIEASVYISEYGTGGGFNDLFQYAHFSADLNVGDKFTWDFKTVVQDDKHITTATTTDEPIEGSTVVFEIIGEPENFDLQSSTANPGDYFKVTLDGNGLDIQETFSGVEDFTNFIFPVNFDFGNGTSYNFFEYAAGHQEEFWGTSVEGLSVTISNNVFTFQGTDSYVDDYNNDTYSYSTYISFDVDTGVMREWHETDTTNGVVNSETHVLRSGVAAAGGGGDNSSGPGIPLPAPGYAIIFPALVAVPIIRRKFSKSG